jgi:hypothetical protein
MNKGRLRHLTAEKQTFRNPQIAAVNRSEVPISAEAASHFDHNQYRGYSPYQITR